MCGQGSGGQGLGRYNDLAVGVLSTPLHTPARPRSEGATETKSGRSALAQSSLCLGVFVVKFLGEVALNDPLGDKGRHGGRWAPVTLAGTAGKNTGVTDE